MMSGVTLLARKLELMSPSSKIPKHWDFPGDPLVKTICFQYRGLGSIPGWGTKIPDTMEHSRKTNKQTKKNNPLTRAQ